jgi:hypothetical protein
MKNLFGASFALASLAGSLLAIPAVQAAEPDMASAPAEACSVESKDDVLKLHLKLDGVYGEAVHHKASIVTVTMTPASEGEAKFGWDIRTTETRRVVKPKAGHAINTKGTGATRTSAPEGEPVLSNKCAAGKHFKDATLSSARAGNSASFTVVKTQSTTAAPDGGKQEDFMRTGQKGAEDVSITGQNGESATDLKGAGASVGKPTSSTLRMRCDLSGDPANPIVTVQLSGNDLSDSGEAVLYFQNVSGAASSCDISRGFTPRKNPA